MTLHPPANRRCMIYIGEPSTPGSELTRCTNEGTHWEKWGGCHCGKDTPFCEGDYFTWECDSTHTIPKAAAA